MATKKAAATTTTTRPRARQTLPQKPTAAPRRALSARPSAADDGARKRLRVSATMDIDARLREHLRARVIGQDDAIEALVRSWARLQSGLRDPQRPLLTALLLGPTGVGKTETARALAEALFGTETALHRINCEEYAHGHEVAKLLGSPPGYVGADIEPLLAQTRIDRPHFERRQPAEEGARAPDLLIDEVHDPDRRLHSILLFDEVEKAHASLWNALLGILEDGRITLGNNTTTDLTRAVILMTTNVGSREMGAAMHGVPLGFGAAEPASADVGALAGIATAAARQVFPAEFLNRFDETLVYAPLGPDELGRIFDKFLAAVNERARERAGVPLLIRTSEKAKSLVIDAGTDPALGARPLRRAMERLLVDPVSRLLAAGQLAAGDVVEVEVEHGRLRFYRMPRSGDRIVA